jgi:hypothetical protein
MVNSQRLAEARLVQTYAPELAEQVLIGKKSEIGPLSSRWRRGASAD